MSARVLLLRVVFLAVALGIVGMHHLAGGHEHGPAAGHHAVMAVHAPASPQLWPPQIWAPPVASGDGAGQHLCLAVLVAATALLALGALGFAVPAPSTRRGGPRAPASGHSRAPPLPRRLADLGVLRI